MATDTLADKFQKLGQPVGDGTDTYSGTPIGAAAVPVETSRLVHTPIAGGTPRPAP